MPLLKAHWKMVVIVAQAAIIAFLLYDAPTSGSGPAPAAVPAKAAPEVAGETKAPSPIACAKVETYKNSGRIKRDLRLPPEYQLDDSKRVLDASTVPSKSTPQTVATVLDMKTGKSSAFVVDEPPPAFAWDTRRRAGIYFGFRNGSKAVRIEGEQNLFDIRSAHVAGKLSLDQPIGGGARPDTYIGIGAWGEL